MLKLFLNKDTVSSNKGDVNNEISIKDDSPIEWGQTFVFDHLWNQNKINLLNIVYIGMTGEKNRSVSTKYFVTDQIYCFHSITQENRKCIE